MNGRLVSISLATVLLGTGAAVPLAAVDTFTAERLAEGTRLLSSDPEEAQRLLRIAAFGLLEEPDLLAVALVRMGIAQSRSRNGDGFRATFDRLLEIERRFGAYREAGLSPAERAAFEEAIPIHISEERLAASELFADLAERRLELKLSRLPEREQRRALEARVAESPQDPQRLLAMARFETRVGREKRALQWLDRLLAAAPGHESGSCLRGRLLAGRGRCDAAADDLAACAQTSTDPDLAATGLRCLVQLERWPEAAELAGTLDGALRSDPEIARLVTRIEGPIPPPSEPRPSAPAAEEPASAQPAPPAATPSLDPELARIRAAIGAATSPQELAAALDEAVALADAHPESTEAQIAAAEGAYLASRWETAARLFDRAPPRPAERPLLVFYHSVSLYESGRPEEAADALRSVLPRLARTAFVEAYVERILGGDGPS